MVIPVPQVLDRTAGMGKMDKQDWMVQMVVREILEQYSLRTTIEW